MPQTRATVAVHCVVLVLAVAAVGCGQEGGGSVGPQANDDEPDETSDAGGDEGEKALTGEFSPLEENTDRDLSGQATLIRTKERTTLSVDVSGLEPEAAHPAHLHEGTCTDQGPHYQHDSEGAEEPPNELWPSSEPEDPTAGLRADADGNASGAGTAEWRAEGPLSVFVHAPGHGHDKIACANLE